MRFSNQKRSYLELALLKMCDVKLHEELSLAERLEQLEQTIQALTTNPIAQPVQEIKPQITLPSLEQINQLKEVEAVSKPLVVESSDEVQIKEVEDILNKASKQRKLELQKIFKQIEQDYAGVFVAQILVAGDLVAVSEDSFIVVLNDLGFCNRLMRYENYVKLIEILDQLNSNIKDYICLPKKIWNVIKTDYMAKYHADGKAVVLNPIQLGVLKRKEPQYEDSKENEVIKQIKEYIDEDKLKIVEE